MFETCRTAVVRELLLEFVLATRVPMPNFATAVTLSRRRCAKEMGKLKDGKAIQICASSFIPHLASDILKNECLLPLLSSRGNNIKFEGFELRVGYTFFGLLPLPLSSINGGKKSPSYQHCEE